MVCDSIEHFSYIGKLLCCWALGRVLRGNLKVPRLSSESRSRGLTRSRARPKAGALRDG